MKKTASRHFNSLFITCLIGCAVMGPLSAVAELPPETRWADPSSVRLDVEFPGNGFHATWNLFRCDCGDLLVRSQLSTPDEVEKGETMLVGGRVILSRGFGEDQAELGSSLDAPALMMQLALSLLERTLPGGPSLLSELQNVAVEEQIGPIHLDSGTAAGSFYAPWKVVGQVEPMGDAKRRFDLHFQFSTGNPGEELVGSMRLSGLADFSKMDFPIPPASDLQGWEFSWMEESDPAAKTAQGTETLGELRARLKKTN
jgi:hypothetical protein